ncbi:hypothetical protein BCR44DRAFT_1439802 [Catenaria anguillulae PL171]|uniref:TRAPP trafficking subunit Trs65-domain-containing protein n=1 Tax=Catenaria anguillulae PL171 TaxID=765915 RepID=A0A1Y2HDT1_9FUNG|nr:hypothetical protein BCR44DRAFT_1439802 [Catenaria anguillulae PL171]
MDNNVTDTTRDAATPIAIANNGEPFQANVDTDLDLGDLGSPAAASSQAAVSPHTPATLPPSWLTLATVGVSPHAMFTDAQFSVLVPDSVNVQVTPNTRLAAVQHRDAAIFDETLLVLLIGHLNESLPGSSSHPHPTTQDGGDSDLATLKSSQESTRAVRQALLERFAASLDVAVQVTVGGASGQGPIGSAAHASNPKIHGKHIHQSNHVYNRRAPGSLPVVNPEDGWVALPMHIPIAYVESASSQAPVSLMFSVSQSALTIASTSNDPAKSQLNASNNGENEHENAADLDDDGWMPTDTTDVVNVIRGLAQVDPHVFGHADISIAKPRSNNASAPPPMPTAGAPSPPSPALVAVNAINTHLSAVPQRVRDDTVLVCVGIENVLDSSPVEIVSVQVKCLVPSPSPMGSAGDENAVKLRPVGGEAAQGAVLAPGDQVDLVYLHVMPQLHPLPPSTGPGRGCATSAWTAREGMSHVDTPVSQIGRATSRGTVPSSLGAGGVNKPLPPLRAGSLPVNVGGSLEHSGGLLAQGAIRATITVVYSRLPSSSVLMAAQWECVLANPLPLFRPLPPIVGPPSASSIPLARTGKRHAHPYSQGGRSPSPTRALTVPTRSTSTARSITANTEAQTSPGLMQKLASKKRLSMTEEAILTMSRTFSQFRAATTTSNSRPTSPVRPVTITGPEQLVDHQESAANQPPRRSSAGNVLPSSSSTPNPHVRHTSGPTSILGSGDQQGYHMSPPVSQFQHQEQYVPLNRDASRESVLASLPAHQVHVAGGALIVTLSVQSATAAVVECGNDMFLDLQIINRTPSTCAFFRARAQFAAGWPYRPHQRQWQRATDSAVSLLLDPEAFSGLAKSLDAVHPAVVCLDHRVRTRDIAPGSVASVRVRFATVRRGVAQVGCVDLEYVGGIGEARGGVIEVRDALAVMVV